MSPGYKLRKVIVVIVLDEFVLNLRRNQPSFFTRTMQLTNKAKPEVNPSVSMIFFYHLPTYVA